MEDLIPVLIFVFFVLSAVVKKIAAMGKKASLKGSPSQQKPSVLGDLIQQIKQQMAEMAEAQKSAKPPEKSPPVRGARKRSPVAPVRSSQVPAQPKPKKSSKPPVAAEPDRAVKKSAPPPVVKPVPSPPSALPSLDSGMSLRNAVIWSEILGPPLALRDPLEGRDLW